MIEASLGRRWRRGVWLMAALVGAMVLALFGPAAPSSAQDGILAPGEVASSDNLSLVANIPRQGVNDGVFQSDLAFWGDVAIQGTYGGLNFYDIKHPQKPSLITQVACPGGQGDPTVSPDGNLVFMSVDSARTDDTCTSSGTSTANPNGWEGVRIFDTSDLGDVKQIAAVRTDCGSHTHTLVPGDEDTLYLYVSSYGPNAAFPNCQPPHDAISIIEVPLDDPASAFVVNKQVLFPDGGASSRTAGCHDITVYPELDLAGGACMGEGVLMDISDPVHPYVIDSVTDANFAFWHSATFNNDASRVIFTDELGGGGGATCNEAVGPERGANAIFDIVGEGDDRELVFLDYYKIPRMQANTENCVAHNGSIIPAVGRDLFVQSWYQGGVSVSDFTDPTNTTEVAFFDRGPLDPPGLGGSWSAYWYNGYIYSSDITLGLDVLKITGTEGIPSANRVKQDHFNAQTQYRLFD